MLTCIGCSVCALGRAPREESLKETRLVTQRPGAPYHARKASPSKLNTELYFVISL